MAATPGPLILFHPAKVRMLNGAYDLDTHAFKVMLLKASWTPDRALADLADLVAHECDDADYARQPLTVTSLALNEGNEAVLAATDTNFGANVSITAKYAAVFDDDHPTDGLLGYVDLDTSSPSGVSSTASQFVVRWPNGVLKVPA